MKVFVSWKKIQPHYYCTNAGNPLVTLTRQYQKGGTDLFLAPPLPPPPSPSPALLTAASKTSISCSLKALNPNFLTVICQSALAFQH